jgi:uncharacterized protein YndB with AHSA1/START domain
MTGALRLERRFDAPPERVWRALLDPEITRQTFLDSGMKDCEVVRDVRVGGKWRITARQGDMEMTTSGEYLEVDRPHRVSFTFAMPQFSPNTDRLTAEFTADGAGCRMTYIQDGPDIAAELAQLKPGEKGGSQFGWEQMLDAMAKALAEGRA